MRQFFVWPLLTLAAAGCGSIRTTPLDRTEADTYVVNPHHPICGVPVMLRVPTHLKVAVIEKRYWHVDPANATITALETQRPTLDVEHKLEYTEKMFIVDPVKPLSGDQAYGFTYTSSDSNVKGQEGNGYLSGMRYKSVDTSIVDSAALIGTALRRFGPQTGAKFSATTGDGKPVPNVVNTTRVVAFRRFDVNSPGLEHEVSEFLCCHLNDLCSQPFCNVTACSSKKKNPVECEAPIVAPPCPPAEEKVPAAKAAPAKSEKP